MTPNQITTLIASGLDRELDIPFKLQLMERVKVWRSRLLANSIEKRPASRKFYRQPYYMKMKTAYAIECLAGVGDKQSISIEELPLMLSVGTTLFDYIGGIDGKSPFREVNPGTDNYMDTGKFADMFPAFVYTGRKVYLNKTGIPCIRIDTVFDDPMAIMESNCGCMGTENCDVWNSEFPCEGKVMQLIIQSIIQIDYNRPENKPTPEIEV